MKWARIMHKNGERRVWNDMNKYLKKIGRGKIVLI